MLRIIEDLVGDWRRLDERIEGLSNEIETLARQDKACERLMTVPGIGPIISSAMVAAIGTGDVFSKGRDFGAWLGLVPKQISTGDRTILGKISRRGNRYLRALFVQAAWVVLVRVKRWERYGLKSWIEAAKKRLHHNVLAICARQQARPDRLGGSQQGTRLRVRQDRGDGVPTCLSLVAVLGAVKARPGRGRARRQDSTTAGLDGPLRAARLRAQAGTKERPPGTNKGTARSEERSMT
jgi:hypothetical protein